MDNNVDLLQIKINEAKANLPEESIKAINAIDWKTVILNMRTEKGYSYNQLEDLETETELLLCGLISAEEYPQELEKRMGIPKNKVEELIEELNEKIFKKIREELAKNIEAKNNEKSENIKNTPSILEQKLGGVIQTQKTETDHSITNVANNTAPKKTVDPYRMPIE